METQLQQDNQVKYNNYKIQATRLKKALKNEFYLEAVFIEYAIVEDRTESILRHGKLWDSYIKKQRGRNPTINSKIKYIQKRAENKKDLLHRYFSDDLLNDILMWKDERNRYIHALMKQQITNSEIAEFAIRGNELVRKLRNKSYNYRRMVEKHQKSE